MWQRECERARRGWERCLWLRRRQTSYTVFLLFLPPCFPPLCFFTSSLHTSRESISKSVASSSCWHQCVCVCVYVWKYMILWFTDKSTEALMREGCELWRKNDSSFWETSSQQLLRCFRYFVPKWWAHQMTGIAIPRATPLTWLKKTNMFSMNWAVQKVQSPTETLISHNKFPTWVSTNDGYLRAWVSLRNYDWVCWCR